MLGYLFGDTNKDKERDELIIMIQPTVVANDADQIAVNEAEKQRTILGREAVEAATGVPPAQQSALVPVTPLGSTQPSVQSSTTTTGSSPFNSKGIRYDSNGPSTTTTTTTVQTIPTQQMTPVGPTTPTGPVPALSTPAPDVQNGRMPTVNPPSPTPHAPSLPPSPSP